jgi:hypothetical protein
VAAAAATDSEEDVIVARVALLAPPYDRVGRPPRFGEDRAGFERKASIVARLKLCHELLGQRRWWEMRDALAQMVSEHGELAMKFCTIISDCYWAAMFSSDIFPGNRWC